MKGVIEKDSLVCVTGAHGKVKRETAMYCQSLSGPGGHPCQGWSDR